MSQNDDQKATKEKLNKPTCPVCQGCGFAQGKICPCIGAASDESIDNIFEMLGIFDPWGKK